MKAKNNKENKENSKTKEKNHIKNKKLYNHRNVNFAKHKILC